MKARWALAATLAAVSVSVHAQFEGPSATGRATSGPKFHGTVLSGSDHAHPTARYAKLIHGIEGVG